MKPMEVPSAAGPERVLAEHKSRRISITELADKRGLPLGWELPTYETGRSILLADEWHKLPASVVCKNQRLPGVDIELHIFNTHGVRGASLRQLSEKQRDALRVWIAKTIENHENNIT